MLTWSQNYAPLGSIGLSSLVATLPIVTLLGLLAFFHVRAQIAALAGLLVALGIVPILALTYLASAPAPFFCALAR